MDILDLLVLAPPFSIEAEIVVPPPSIPATGGGGGPFSAFGSYYGSWETRRRRERIKREMGRVEVAAAMAVAMLADELWE